ncbi:hypothetical protein ACQ4PT_051932 [Festuca glaucescens]
MAKKIVAATAATAWVLVCYVVSGGGKRLAGAKYCPRLLARSPRSSLALSRRPLPLPTRPSVSAYGGGTSKQDAFTRCSGYLFEEEVAAEGISTPRTTSAAWPAPAAPRAPVLALAADLQPLVCAAVHLQSQRARRRRVRGCHSSCIP